MRSPASVELHAGPDPHKRGYPVDSIIVCKGSALNPLGLCGDGPTMLFKSPNCDTHHLAAESQSSIVQDDRALARPVGTRQDNLNS
jgi:hypothetical protein